MVSDTGTQSFYPVEILVSGQDRVGERHGHKYTQTSPGYRMKYKTSKITETKKEGSWKLLQKIQSRD